MNKHILSVWAEPAAGPGWSNTPIRYIGQNEDGSYFEGWLQPEEQTEAMRVLYSISATVNNKLIKEISKVSGN